MWSCAIAIDELDRNPVNCWKGARGLKWHALSKGLRQRAVARNV